MRQQLVSAPLNGRFARRATALIVGCSCVIAAAQPMPPEGGGLYRLNNAARYQHGCFPPCLCPLLEPSGVRGTFNLGPAVNNAGIIEFPVHDVNWSVPGNDPFQVKRVTGGGVYRFGSPGPTTVLQHRLELDLTIAGEPAQHFDSGWVLLQNNGASNIRITISRNNVFCFDTVFDVDASIVPAGDILPYKLAAGSTFRRGCNDGVCACPPGPEVPMGGTFALVPVLDLPLALTEYAVVNVDWHVLGNAAGVALPVRGSGVYQLIGDFVAQHRLALDLVIGSEPRTHFDSGIQFGGGLPLMDAVITHQNDPCFGTVMHVVAEPAAGFCGNDPHHPPCANNQFCRFPAGHCDGDAPGVCTPFPQGCPDVWMPVCGCNNVTYGNECDADAAGVSIAHDGECGANCFVQGDCTATGQFCKFPVGNCGMAALGGTCAPIPNACPEVYIPVCGCDGQTYSNECDADAASVSIAHLGACERACGNVPGLPPCAAGLFCLFPEGSCGNDPALGMCAPIPQGCPDNWDPVCGCDGMTYSNECDAHAAGVSIRSHGECPRLCSNAGGVVPCSPGEFCKLPTGTCDNPNAPGVCTVVSENCPLHYDPVCGCDGVTYGNECESDAAAVSLDHDGECDGTLCVATRVFEPALTGVCHQLPLVVRFNLAPPAGTTVLGLEDTLPAGWTAINISDDGTFDHANGKVKWGPFFAPDIPAFVRCQVVPMNDQNVAACFDGTVSIDGANKPICGAACVNVFCPPLVPADVPQPPCPHCPVGDCDSCPGGSCRDGRVSLCEVIGYACAWKNGCNDDLSGMARAAYIWRRGECYCRDDAAGNWFPVACPPPPDGYCLAAGDPNVEPGDAIGAAAIVLQPLRGSRGFLIRGTVRLGDLENATAIALEVDVPERWRVVSVEGGGQWDADHRKIKWGPFFDAESAAIIAFELTPYRLSGFGGPVRPNGIAGRISLDGSVFPMPVGYRSRTR